MLGLSPGSPTTVVERASERTDLSKLICAPVLQGNQIALGHLPGGPQHQRARPASTSSWAYLTLVGCAAILGGRHRPPGVPGQGFNIAVLPWTTPARSSNDLILLFPVVPHHRSARMPADSISQNLTFRSRVRPLMLLHERHNALLMSVSPPLVPRRVLPCQARRKPICSSLSCKWRELFLLLLTACRLGMNKTTDSCGFTGNPAAQQVRVIQLDETERRQESRVESPEGLPCPPHAALRLLCPALHIRPQGLQGSKTARQQGERGGRADKAADSSTTPGSWTLAPPEKVFASPTLAHDDGRGHGRGHGNGMGEPMGDGETQGDIVAVKLFRCWACTTLW